MKRARGAGQPPKQRPWGHKRLGKMKLEYDCSIVMHGQVVGKIGPDDFTDVCREIVRRWNSFEDPKRKV
jgi:hypothetical protein